MNLDYHIQKDRINIHFSIPSIDNNSKLCTNVKKALKEETE